MSPLELRCRLLLVAYPAGYRDDHGEEIIGTLLEATPDGRSWPRLRDMLAIAAAGLRARCTLNRQRTTWANVRIAVVVGVAAYLCLDAAVWFHTTHVAKLCTVPRYCSQFAGPPWLGPALIAAAAVLACVCRWRAIIACAVLPAAVLVWLATGTVPYILGAPAVVLPCLAILVLLGGRSARPGSAWLWPLAAIAVAPWLIGPYASLAPVVAVLAVVVFSIAWIAVDAKLAIAVFVFVGAVLLSSTTFVLDSPQRSAEGFILATVAAIGALALWRLRKQSAAAS